MIRIVIGPMWSGKTFSVIRLARRYRAIGKQVLFIDHTSDTRYTNGIAKHLVSHDGMQEHCLFSDNLLSLLDNVEYLAADVVIIEEAQFFPDLLQFIQDQGDLGKDFIISGLVGDYQRKPIGDILKIIPFAERVDKLDGLCKYCADGTPGCFTKRIVDNSEQVLVGGKDMYECVCRVHYL